MAELNWGTKLSSEEVAVKSVVQQGNLKFLENSIRDYWRLGQNIVLCWCATPRGIDMLMVPHYFLAEHTTAVENGTADDRLKVLNASFLKNLIGKRRQMCSETFAATSRRLEIAPVSIQLPVPLADDEELFLAVDRLVKRYSITYVESRAVLLFDIVDFSLFTPFQQVSQLNSLSYSLNSAYNKLLKQNIEVNFARTTTGDGFYIWNRDSRANANINLFHFMLLVVADNAIAHRKSQSCTVPRIRTGFHLGGHYEFYQVEGINPTLFSYIVGDVTIELARMVDLAEPGQIFVGDFQTLIPTSNRDGAYPVEVSTQQFVERTVKNLVSLRGAELSGERIKSIKCYLTGETGSSGGHDIREFRVVDKHGKERSAYNLRINMYLDHSEPLYLGIQPGSQKRVERRSDRERRRGDVERKYSAYRNLGYSPFPGGDKLSRKN